MKLREILEIHQSTNKNKNVLSNVIGDGYLYKTSAIFKAIRDTLLEFGYRLEQNPPFPYNSFPLIALVEILERKVVPYTPNIFFLRKLESLRANFFKAKDIYAVANYLLHESSHCIGHHILGGPPIQGWANQASSERADIVKIMLAESFANTTEFMSASQLRNSQMNKWFLAHNMYFGVQTDAFEFMVKKIGLRQTVKLTVLLFLYSNFLAVDIMAKGKQKIFEILKINKEDQKNKSFEKNFNKIKKKAFSLNPTFRVTTTEIYLHRLGFTKSLSRLLSFDPMDIILRSPELQEKLDQLGDVIDGRFVKKQNNLVEENLLAG